MNSQSNNNFNNPRSIPGQCQGPNQYPINPNQYNVNPNPNYNQIPNASSEQVDKWFKSPAKPTAVPGDPANPLTDQIYPSLQAPPSQAPKTTNPPPPPSPETLYYPMRNPRRRGHCLILNYATFDQFQVGGGSREGTETDVHTLVTTFTTLGFDVLQPYTNLTRQATIDVLYFESKVNHADADCFALCILSHGDRNDVIYCTDGPLKVDYILGLFTSEKCASLMGKPKLFFIQACRGNQIVQPPVGKALGSHDLPTERKGAENSGSDGIFFLLPNYADFLIFYSTYPGFYSWRNTFTGSWFVQDLCYILNAYSDSYDLATMATLVCQKVAFTRESNAPGQSKIDQKKAIPCYMSTLTKLIKFSK